VRRLKTGEDPEEPSDEGTPKGRATAVLIWLLIRLAAALIFEGVKYWVINWW
jgi:hypothetical protein